MIVNELYEKQRRPQRVIQFGTGGFLRGFFDWMLEVSNRSGVTDASVVMVESTGSGAAARMNAQDCVYTHLMRGSEGTQSTVVSCVSRAISAAEDWEGVLSLARQPQMRFVVSNTTESGIAYQAGVLDTDDPPRAFPAKVACLIRRRMDAGLPGFVFLPCELIRQNGGTLRDLVLRYGAEWNYGDAFSRYVAEENIFCDTLVDRINTGRISEEEAGLSYEDPLANASEYYHLWVISAPDSVRRELPLDRAGLNVVFTDDLDRYHTRKVRVLNGAHTSTVALAMNRGIETVGEAVSDGFIGEFMRHSVYDEILPTLDLPVEELTDYADAVFTRFANPYIRHAWKSISLNSVSKFRVRVLPSILEYEKRFGHAPENLTRSLAEMIRLYRTQDVQDDPALVSAMRGDARAVLQNQALFGEDLSRLLPEVEKWL